MGAMKKDNPEADNSTENPRKRKRRTLPGEVDVLRKRITERVVREAYNNAKATRPRKKPLYSRSTFTAPKNQQQNQEDKPKKKRKRGRPSKKDTIPREQLIFLYVEKGCTDVDVAEFYGVTDRTIENWKNSDPDFFRALKDWKKIADRRVERCLYERATGYEVLETKVQWVTDPFDGGRWETFDVMKHYPPDVTSMIFWLKNRQRENWGDIAHGSVDPEEIGQAVRNWATEAAGLVPGGKL